MNKEQFTTITSNWDSHRPLLWAALEATQGLVVEMGIGEGSTPYLSEYCKERNRELVSYENNEEWYNKMKDRFSHNIVYVKNWDFVQVRPSLLFIDHAPGERRRVDLYRFSDIAKVVVCHDTEPAAEHGYKMGPVLDKFKYRLNYKTDGAWATAVSNFIDVTKFDL